jgi:hypothetical protein
MINGDPDNPLVGRFQWELLKNGLIYFLMKPLCTAVHNKDMNQACELPKAINKRVPRNRSAKVNFDDY